MFKVNYRITDTAEELNNLSEEEIDRGGSIEGYFEIKVNDKSYGYFKQGPLVSGERGLDLITYWLEQLLEVLLILAKEGCYALLDDIESHNTWLECKRLKNEKVCISVIKSEKKAREDYMVTQPLDDFVYSDWANEIVSYDEMHKEIISKVSKYLDEVRQINEKLVNGRKLIQLKNLLNRVKACYKL